MNNVEVTQKALLKIQDDHCGFFKENGKTIFDYITIYWNEPVSIKIHDRRIDPLVNQDIIEQFHVID